jgi:PAS domain S-box-containing protein
MSETTPKPPFPGPGPAPRPAPDTLFRYTIPPVAVAIALGFTLLLWPVVEQGFFPVFLGAVFVAAWFGGLGPGLVATALAALTSAYFLFPPIYSFAVELEALPRFGLFVIIALVIAALTGARRAHVESEKSLRRSAERYRSLVSATTSVVWTADVAGAFVVPQPSWEAYTGQPWAEHRGRGWTEMIHRDDRPTVEALWAHAVAERSLYESRGRLWHAASGEYRHFVARAAPLLNPDGTIREWIGTVADIHDRRQADEAAREAERRFGRLATLAPVGIFQTDAAGDRTFVNERWSQIAGLAPEEAVGRGWVRALHPDDRARVLAEWYSAVGAGREFRSEYRLSKPDGEVTWVVGAAVALRGPQGEITGYIGTVMDITERKQAEEERAELLARERRARAEAEAANRAKDEFLATLSHELRTPLNAILGWASILAAGKRDSATLARAAETIARNARAQAELIDDLLDVSRIITGRLRLDTRAVNLLPVIEAALDAVAPAAEAKRIRLEAVLDPEAGSVAGDPARLQQVVWNLLSNGVKFTPPGGRVEVRLERLDSQVEIRVSDSGEGIRPEFLPHVFDRFRQADSSTTRTHGGLGLGLAIVRHLVELHGGTVHADSAGEGQGSTFAVRLPVRSAAPRLRDAERRPAAAAGEGTRPPAIGLTGLRVLVVDDDADARVLLSAALEDHGAQVTAVGSTAEAVSVLDRVEPHVLLADIAMPGEDGYALIRRVRTREAGRGRRLPAAALTAYAGAEDRERALAAGFDRHVRKPVEARELATIVAELAGRAAA